MISVVDFPREGELKVLIRIFQLRGHKNGLGIENLSWRDLDPYDKFLIT